MPYGQETDRPYSTVLYSRPVRAPVAVPGPATQARLLQVRGPLVPAGLRAPHPTPPSLLSPSFPPLP